MNLKPALYLIPVPMSEATKPIEVLPVPVLQIVKQLKFFAVENLRSARRFLKGVDKEIDISAIEFTILDEHTRPDAVPSMLTPLKNGNPMGVISEAGCPGIADPGALLVEAARRDGFEVVPLIGPSSIILGLMGSGFNGQNFAFNGYLPVDAREKSKRLKELVRRIIGEKQTQIFIETPYRNNRLIADLCQQLAPQLRLCVACELTSPEEDIKMMTLAEWKTARYDYSKKPAIFLLSSY